MRRVWLGSVFRQSGSGPFVFNDVNRFIPRIWLARVVCFCKAVDDASVGKKRRDRRIDFGTTGPND
jgi:hypothetical protein